MSPNYSEAEMASLRSTAVLFTSLATAESDSVDEVLTELMDKGMSDPLLDGIATAIYEAVGAIRGGKPADSDEAIIQVLTRMAIAGFTVGAHAQAAVQAADAINATIVAMTTPHRSPRSHGSR